MSITFDSVQIQNSTYTPRFVQHESVADRIVSSLPLAREDGEVLISERYGTKVIRIQGTIRGTSQADLESKIDTFTELFSRPEKNLDIDWNSGTRRYVATCLRHEFNRDHFHINVVPWTAEFVVLSGEGKETSETTLLNEHVVATSTPGTDSFTFAGSKPPKPRITLKGANFSSLIRGIEYLNTDTGEKIVATRNTGSWGTDSTTIIDCAAKTVTSNAGVSGQQAITFYGAFPQFRIGSNNVQITVGGIVNQTTSDTDAVNHTGNTSYDLTSTNHKMGQSFMVPYTDDTFQGVTFVATKTGSPGNLTWRIETDTNGKPSGTLVHANATGTVATADVSGARAYITDYAGGAGDLFTLQANTVYWLVIKAASVDGSNYYSIAESNYTDYVRGFAVRTLSAGDYTDNDLTGLTDLAFRIRYGGTPDTTSTKHSVHYTKTYL
jgi:hypothetical protein